MINAPWLCEQKYRICAWNIKEGTGKVNKCSCHQHIGVDGASPGNSHKFRETIQFLPASWEGCRSAHELTRPWGVFLLFSHQFVSDSLRPHGPQHTSRTLLIPREKSPLNLTEFTNQSGTSVLPWGPSVWWLEPETRNIDQNLWILKVHAEHIPERTGICSVLLPWRTSLETFRFHFVISSQNVHKQKYSYLPYYRIDCLWKWTQA